MELKSPYNKLDCGFIDTEAGLYIVPTSPSQKNVIFGFASAGRRKNFERKRLVSGLKALLVCMLCQNLSLLDIGGAENGQSAQQVRFAKSGLVRARGGGEQRAITDNSRR